ncbi:MAG: AAA family ATPase, partial [Bacteroidales bacterium]|nr:AAA family ATPase [Bacteroidales bacterium]
MLKQLSIENYALIRSVSLTFDSGFTVITGETGAGKSILLGALGLLLGHRADTQVLFDKEKKCVVEAVFEIGRPEVSRILAENDLDEGEDGTLLLRREITAAGKSRAFVNDTPCGLPVLKALSGYLVDIHSQHKTMDMVRPSFLLEIVDGYIPEEKRVAAEYAPLYKRYGRVQADLQQLRDVRAAWEREQGYWRFLYEELEAARLRAGEQAELEAVLARQQHAEQIKAVMDEAQAVWEQGEEAMEGKLSHIVRQLGKIAVYHADLQAALPRWESALIELKDLQADLRVWSGTLDFSSQEKAANEERLGRIYALENKYKVRTVEELIGLRDRTAEKLEVEDGRAEEQARLEAEAVGLEARLEELAIRWRTARLEAGDKLTRKTQEALADLAMPDATLVLQWEEEAGFGPRGKDRVRLLFNANRGGEQAELGKVASG